MAEIKGNMYIKKSLKIFLNIDFFYAKAVINSWIAISCCNRYEEVIVRDIFLIDRRTRD